MLLKPQERESTFTMLVEKKPCINGPTQFKPTCSTGNCISFLPTSLTASKTTTTINISPVLGISLESEVSEVDKVYSIFLSYGPHV